MAESPNNTLVLKPTDPPIINATNVKWTFNTSGRVTFDGTRDFNTSDANKMAYVNRLVNYRNTSNQWFQKTTSWVKISDPTIVPPPANDTIIVTIAAKITDKILPKFIVSLGPDGDVISPITSVNVAADNVHWQTITFTGKWPTTKVAYLTFLNAANNRALVVKSISFDANTYKANSNNVIVLSGQGDSTSFSR